jgi:Flp pilus assembly protein TadB
MPAKDLIFVLVLLVAIGLALLCALLDRRLARQRQAHARLAEELAAARRSPPVPAAAPAPSRAFAADFEQASLRQRLQRSDGRGEVPEKYRLVAAMAERGLGAEDIAAVLQLPAPEVAALLRLSLVSRGAA